MLPRTLQSFWRLLPLVLCPAALASAEVVIAPATPQVGSANPAPADPTVPRPHTHHCTVPLFTDLEFADFNAKTFSYTPPSDCKGPWSKVVFTADFTVTAGRQYDRTAAFYLGHANIYYGTTAEPSKTVSPSWHVERDVTDLAAIFKKAQTGEADLGNFVGVYNGVNYNGIIYANAALEFYTYAPWAPAPHVADVVVPLPDAEGGAATLNTTASQLTQTVTLPENVEKVYLDLITQSQSGDEFWYFCVPNDVTAELQSCGNTGFREAEVSIDNQPAGVAPVYPWIYTGGIDPYDWRPTPGVQTLNFHPYRLNLTPFAGMLADGKQHTVAVSVFNANGYFLVTGNLLVFLDHGAKQVTGAVVSNNLTASPSPNVQENLTTNASGDVSGSVDVNSPRQYAIKGYVNTSHGRIETTVEEKLAFDNKQTFEINAAKYIQHLQQSTIGTQKTTWTDGYLTATAQDSFEYPLTLHYDQVLNPNKTFYVITAVQQADNSDDKEWLNGLPIFTRHTVDQVSTSDTLFFDAAGNLVKTYDRNSAQRFATRDSLGYCYDRVVTTSAGLVTAVKDGEGCQTF